MFIEMPTFDAFYRDVYQDLGRFIKIWGFIRIWGGLGYGEVLSRLLSGYGEDLSQRLSGYGEVGSLQSLACLAIENLVRKSLDQVDIIIMLMMPMMIMMLMLPMMMNH